MSAGDLFALFAPGWLDILEILIVAALVYRILLFIQRTRAMQILLGGLLIAGVYAIARLLGLDLMRSIMDAVFQYGAIAALVVFQPEIRSTLARLGQARMLQLFSRLGESQVVEEIAGAAERLSSTKIGALIALEGDVGLDEYAQTGSPLRARVSRVLLGAIFTPNAPLHDGAVIVSGDTIKAAGAILPLNRAPVPDRTLGTRHRAAIGLSEETDAVVVVVSEETGRISVASRGVLEKGVDGAGLRKAIAGAGPRATTGTREPAGSAGRALARALRLP